jgi:hypothetical protein
MTSACPIGGMSALVIMARCAPSPAEQERRQGKRAKMVE